MQIKLSGGLYSIFFRRLEEVQSKIKSDILPFPYVFEKLCRNFSITKKECWEVLFILRDTDLIEIVPFHGVKLRK